MAWYKMTCSHGPGHQSSSMKFAEARNITEARENLESWCEDHRWVWEYPIAKVELIKRFTKEEKSTLLNELYGEERWHIAETERIRDQINGLDSRKDG